MIAATLPARTAWTPTSDALIRLALRGVLSAGIRGAYRLRVRGLEHVPRTGPAIIAANHVSFIDWLFVGVAISHRTPRFVMHEEHFESPLFRWFFDLHRVIAIAPHKVSPERLREGMAAIDEALVAGELVMLFPEGTMTPDGQLSPLRPGIERIVRERPVPVVPMGLCGLFGSFFSRAGGGPMRKWPARLARPFPGRRPVEVRFGAPIAPSAFDLPTLEAALEDLRRP